MELEHFSHRHPLLLKTEQGDEGEHVACAGCEIPILGPSYSCSSCHYFLHTKCALLPWAINSHLHREHPLILLAKPPSYYSSCLCDLCKKTCRSFVYHCALCSFDLDMNCAFPPDVPNPGMRGRDMVLVHFSHQDPLIFINDRECDGERVICYGCEEPVFGPSYRCIECNFILHMKCAELPWDIKSHLHPEHCLTLIDKPSVGYRCTCDLCGKICRSFVYRCSLCNFDLDITCAIPPCIFEVNLISSKHFSHPHPLTFNEEQEKNGGPVICFGCGKRVLGSSYSCVPCNFTLHEKCFELPREISKSHLHREHLLTLRAEPPPRTISICDPCRKTCHSFYYYCSICNFVLDISCAFPPCIFEPEGQGHRFMCLVKSFSLNSFSFTCSACGTDGDDSPFLCTTCQLMFHEKCISLPHTINIPLHHPHPINHTYFLREDANGNNDCKICQNEVSTYYGGYECRDCNFVAHVNCAMGNTVASRVQDDKPRLAAYVGSADSAAGIVRESKHGEDNRLPEIKHFSHEHNLTFIEEAVNDNCCDGCMLPISPPYYGCADCNFFLDLTCFELPNEIQFLHGGLPLILHSKESTTVDGVFRCSACHQHCSGFTYKCEEVGLNFDVRCCSLVSSTPPFNHEGHEHPLFFATGTKDRQCSACSDSGWPFLFSCAVCSFTLDFRCATLPNKAGHRYDRHPLFLTYNHSVNDGSDELYCDICEHERDSKLWFYYCAECKFSAHPKCVLGKNPFVKLGKTYRFDIHHHPLTLLQKRRKFPPCHACCMPCDDLALECCVSQCNFIVHRKKDYCVFPGSQKKEGK